MPKTYWLNINSNNLQESFQNAGIAGIAFHETLNLKFRGHFEPYKKGEKESPFEIY